MSRTVYCPEEVIVVSKGKEDIGRLVALGNDGKFDPSVIPVIDDLQNQITKEVAARTEADEQLQANLDVEVLARTNADAKLQGNIEAEATARGAADKDLQDKIATEIVDRTNGDNQLQVNVDAEVAARTAADQNLQDEVTKEIADRTNADNVLQANIDAEANTRVVADKDLQEQLTKEVAARTDSDTVLQSNVDKEIATRSDADSKLQIAVNTEVDARTKADQGLQDQITTEITARSEADKQLQANIDNARTEAISYTDTKVAGLVNSAPSTLDTLKELADALNDDSNFATNVTNQLAQKADKSQIPTSLPANGGNADTVDGKHASDFAPAEFGVPVGTVTYLARQTAPAGWLKADGSTISRTQYANLFATVGTMFGTGDGSTTFNLPDLRGEFIRGFDGGRGVDQGRMLGSLQNDVLKEHIHNIITVDVSNTAAFTINDHSGDMIVSTDNVGGYNSDGSVVYGEVKTNRYFTETIGDIETRPRNIALLACIKY
jgi:microcystin-dependent protein